MSKFIIPTENELRAQFHNLCEELLLDDRCEECRYKCRYTCLSAYIYDVLTFRCDQRESFLFQCDDCEDLRQQDWDEWCEQLKAEKDVSSADTPQPVSNGENCQALQKSPLETLPAWCKVDQWVISKAGLKLHQSVEACFLKQIDEVDLDGHILFKTRTGERFSDCWERFIPVRFRPYTYYEAEGLLGKTMKCERDGKHSTHIVTFVQESSWHVEINGYPFTLLAEKFSATIDGLPIGVPVVDEEAMKEVK